jgi:hypothetical protein
MCGCRELYRQRDFNHRLAIVFLILGAILAYPTKGLSLVAAAILDLVLYLTAAELLVCYLCRAHVRGHLPGGGHGRFDSRVEEDVRARHGREANSMNSHESG